ncbi:MAG: radical SAM family heme chaperone HemW [Actinobacteria bacterium]|nr:radical SAM family heme chaperone HemW [Actinomycetota bacterium]
MRLYVHWPFCVSRCAYCDFNARTAGSRTVSAYAASLRRELTLWSAMLPRDGGLRSLYLGGGTPSTMRGDEVADLIAFCRRLFPLREGAEVTVEVNPATWKERDFAAALEGGVNRVSIGVQSLRDCILLLLGRAHDARDAAAAVRAAGRAGFRNISLDLMFGLPLECGHRLGRDLEAALRLRPQHVSLYALEVSARSRLGRAVMRGELHLPEDDRVADEYREGARTLKLAGYERYEISNFCLPGHECRHNLAYWRREAYLGAGAGAHSLLGGWRFHNLESVLSYNRSLREDRMPVAGGSRLTERDARSERIMLGLRTSRGVPAALLAGAKALSDLERYGLVRREGSRISLTERGMLLSNPVIAEVLPA